jgi:acyl carrier protein
MKNQKPTAVAPSGHDTFAIVQRIIAETTGNELEDITLDADLEEDLGINMMNEFPMIVTKIQKNIDVVLPVNSVKECVTVAELVELVDDERDL